MFHTICFNSFIYIYIYNAREIFMVYIEKQSIILYRLIKILNEGKYLGFFSRNILT